MDTLGHHLLVELFECNKSTLNDVDKVKEILIKAAERSSANILKTAFHKFNPHGVSGVVVIAESHLSIHTWPEHGYAAADIFTCGNTLKPNLAVEYMISHFEAKYHKVVEVTRGILNKCCKLKHKQDNGTQVDAD
ncbi:MAG: adenosylmethionine decarboxylase [bacterium]|nr:adenosylmethionine decarboxylase [bacterium]